jgi:hypothetical protein
MLKKSMTNVGVIYGKMGRISLSSKAGYGPVLKMEVKNFYLNLLI